MIVKCRKKPGRHLRQLRHERRCCCFVGELCSLQSAILAESRFRTLLRALRGGAPRRKKRITRRPRATIATVATNASMFLVCSETVAEVANVAPPACDMSPWSGFANVDWKRSCKSTQKGFNARSDASKALQSCFFVLKMSPELQLSQAQSAKLEK